MANIGGIVGTVIGWLGYQMGLRTDAADASGSLHAKIKNIVDKGIRNKQVIASNNLKLSADTERTTNITSYVLIKRIAVYITGVYRISFDLKSSNTVVNGRIYRNGVAYGTERATNSSSYITYTEDLPFKEGDCIELYAKSPGEAVDATLRNFRISFDYATSLLDGFVLLN